MKMVNHPNRSLTYWELHPRNFVNEYIIGIATTKEDAEQYQAEGFSRVERDQALRQMSYRPESHEQRYVTVTIDGESVEDRYDAARALRTGRGIASIETYSYSE